eukprot:CAMPEP_0175947098 /NCGR_PEP_ID=MMETSP0108-20121206/27696_1 /TAXON_ID=195067 ORGANISM="Goniomonas pacifica, Strain CCMP1869" /NCGR_SAMPLE_ID=MMETSP0108 /ASSEMBLY_ACC=CAM_ASM_000204 /LENGTH=52 /DNA_ID=CAMNT_0017272689 /DNA_START=17 /DNA_END=175 /DNA_ORIENTATION=-
MDMHNPASRRMEDPLDFHATLCRLCEASERVHSDHSTRVQIAVKHGDGVSIA